MLVLQQLVSGQQCGTVGRVGSTRTGSMDNRERNQFFIDRGNRGNCSGMITSISYCYHRPPGDVQTANEYLTTVAVYRPASTDTNENVFTNVSSPITIQKSATELDTELNAATDTNFACSVFNLPQPVPMATGDVLGACVFDPPDDTTSGVTTFRLDIVSRAVSGSENIVRTNTQPDIPAGCSATTVPSSFDGTSIGNRGSTDRSLHLWANIGISLKMNILSPSLNTDYTEQVTTGATITEEPGPLITDGDSTTATTNRGTTSNPDATTAQPIDGGNGGSNVTTIVIAVVVVLIVVIALVAILLAILVLLRRRSKALHSVNSIGNCFESRRMFVKHLQLPMYNNDAC